MLSNNPGYTMPSMKNQEANNNLYVPVSTENNQDPNCNCAAFLDPFPNQITWRYVFLSEIFCNVLYVTLLLRPFASKNLISHSIYCTNP